MTLLCCYLPNGALYTVTACETKRQFLKGCQSNKEETETEQCVIGAKENIGVYLDLGPLVNILQ